MLSNTPTRYGVVARSFHWVIALLILTDLALGLWGEATPRNADTSAFLQALYSIHKTIGVTVLFLAIARIIWAATQPRPVPVHASRKAETFAAEVVHWALYGAILVMPLSGWVTHAAESGFAPIWWPFGQTLPFVPQSETVAHTAGAIHGLSAWVIYLTVALHIGGALKHAFIDKDNVLARMTKGTEAGDPNDKTHHAVPAIAAFVIWAAVIALPILSRQEVPSEPAPATASAPSATPQQMAGKWAVLAGRIGFSVNQMGSPVEGQLPNFTATIAYDETTGTGHVRVDIDTTTLTLGSVTDQARGPEFFDTTNAPKAVFEADITRTGGTSHQATGTLTLVGQTSPVTLDFDLRFDDSGTAMMTGATTLDRRMFGMGAGYPDESTVGFAVTVDVSLTAKRM